MKLKTAFICQNCGYRSPRWLGRCPDCQMWNSLVEEEVRSSPEETSARGGAVEAPVLLEKVSISESIRLKTGIGEFDRVLGGGIVQGSVVLIGGDPGVGKSTVSLQISRQVALQGKTVLYISGEESVQQTKLRAERLGAGTGADLFIVNQTDISLIREYVRKLSPAVLIVDSIQVVYDPALGSSPGSVGQVRECAGMLTRLAKSTGTAVFLIGHVTKEGTLAGPRVLEHIVDTVLYFEGDRFALYRVLRAVKNRFGSTNEIGVFEMTSGGLREVSNPSEIFLSERPENTPGSVVTAVMEGTRPVLVEIQALVSRSGFGYARRRAQGFDSNRLSLLVAVLEKRIGYSLETEDIFVNVVGGMKIEDPVADLAVACSVASAFRGKPLSGDALVLGEVGLAGEVRSVSQAGARVKEGEKLGFKKCLLPKGNMPSSGDGPGRMQMAPVSSLREALDILLGG
ncbi:MAG: DNA repair protein RadA [Candidatus Omnitrophota bacterium]